MKHPQAMRNSSREFQDQASDPPEGPTAKSAWSPRNARRFLERPARAGARPARLSLLRGDRSAPAPLADRAHRALVSELNRAGTLEISLDDGRFRLAGCPEAIDPTWRARGPAAGLSGAWAPLAADRSDPDAHRPGGIPRPAGPRRGSLPESRTSGPDARRPRHPGPVPERHRHAGRQADTEAPRNAAACLRLPRLESAHAAARGELGIVPRRIQARARRRSARDPLGR